MCKLAYQVIVVMNLGFDDHNTAKMFRTNVTAYIKIRFCHRVLYAHIICENRMSQFST